MKEAGSAIASAVSHWPKLKKLNVGDCLLGDEGVVLISEALKEGHEHLVRGEE